MTSHADQFVATVKAAKGATKLATAKSLLVDAIVVTGQATGMAELVASHCRAGGINPVDALTVKGNPDPSLVNLCFDAFVEAKFDDELKALLAKTDDELTVAEAKRLSEAKSPLWRDIRNLLRAVISATKRLERAEAEAAEAEKVATIYAEHGKEAADKYAERTAQVKAAEKRLIAYTAMVNKVDQMIRYWEGAELPEGTNPSGAKAFLMEYKAKYCTVKLLERK